MTDVEAIQALLRLRLEGRVRSWTACCEDDGIHTVLIHWTHRRVPTGRSGRGLGEAIVAALEDEG